MLKHTIWMLFLGLMVGGCATDGNMESAGSSSPEGGRTAVRSQTMSGGAAVSTPTMSAAEASTNTMNPSTASKSRIAAGVEEETLETCLAHIPQDASVGQRMLAEQTCRRDFAIRR